MSLYRESVSRRIFLKITCLEENTEKYILTNTKKTIQKEVTIEKEVTRIDRNEEKKYILHITIY